ncbi:HAD family hydrolase [Pseudemcibacter aquimaris]|uniref:HAD family hydrolase n=1 Tax=Pseudemcibacter aquimaris TaxID=2857064 RepID=UPI002011D9EB|nr:HAD family hydrolase [Pseudemcibacter aquimaris]MCC3860898.1 HAD family hydrolase [Pseudemcibacter aquimaris]WDU59717.1 HAD family hydrolase [Pseudemcibacter aquimaris]
MQFDLVIFDCDGVLVDSEPIANVLLRDALAEHGLDMTVERVIDTYVGRSMAAVVSISEEMLGSKLPDDFLDVLQEKTFAAFERELKAVDGIEDVLLELKRRDVQFCVASSGSFEKMDKTLGITGLKQYFGDRIYNSSQVKRGKPYPDLFLYAANQMSVEPARCLLIEDSIPGVQGGVAAGMEVMAYSTRNKCEDLKKAGGLVINDMRAILNHIS